MSAGISITYPETRLRMITSFTPGWHAAITEIFRRVLSLVRRRSFKISVETIAVLSIFTAATIWIFALAPGLSNL